MSWYSVRAPWQDAVIFDSKYLAWGWSLNSFKSYHTLRNACQRININRNEGHMKHDSSLPLFSSIQTSTRAAQNIIGEKVDRLQFSTTVPGTYCGTTLFSNTARCRALLIYGARVSRVELIPGYTARVIYNAIASIRAVQPSNRDAHKINSYGNTLIAYIF